MCSKQGVEVSAKMVDLVVSEVVLMVAVVAVSSVLLVVEV